MHRSIRYRSIHGFTLVEMLVTIVLVSLGVVGVFGGIAALDAAETRARTADLLQGLAMQKMNELGAVTDVTTADTSGDFSDQGYPDVTWKLDVEPSGATNVDQVTVTTTRGQEEQSLTNLVFIRPTTGGTTP